MLSKAIATSFNSPIVTMPGSGFAQTFIGMDVVIVMFLIRKARKLARKWGGKCIIFIDEIDAVGMRRQALQGSMRLPAAWPAASRSPPMYGPWGALTSTGDLVLENAPWRDRLFMSRAEPTAPDRARPARAPCATASRASCSRAWAAWAAAWRSTSCWCRWTASTSRRSCASSSPTASTRSSTRPTSSRSKIGRLRLRIKPPKPRPEQVYFIGATNVPIEALDPALIRPGRMGRHIWFRTPTKDDRKDIFDLYLARSTTTPTSTAPSAATSWRA